MGARYYHGGPRGLDKQGWLLPPTRTGIAAAVDFLPDGQIESGHVRRDRVFITTSMTVAELFARMHPSGRGAIYEVTPFGNVEPDPDYDGEDTSFQVEKAMIRRVVKRVKFSRELLSTLSGQAQAKGAG